MHELIDGGQAAPSTALYCGAGLLNVALGVDRKGARKRYTHLPAARMLEHPTQGDRVAALVKQMTLNSIAWYGQLQGYNSFARTATPQARPESPTAWWVDCTSTFSSQCVIPHLYDTSSVSLLPNPA